MYVDACAIVSLMAGEEAASAYADALPGDGSAWTSTLAPGRRPSFFLAPANSLTRSAGRSASLSNGCKSAALRFASSRSRARFWVSPVVFAERHGLGKRALSNFDGSHYAYAKATGAPILTLDCPLRETDAVARPWPLVNRDWHVRDRSPM